MTPMKGAALGAGAGLIIAIWGAAKDTQWEPFEGSKFLRSPTVGAIAGAIVAALAPSSPAWAIFSGAVVGERSAVELWKGLDRRPGKFTLGAQRDHGWLLAERSATETRTGSARMLVAV